MKKVGFLLFLLPSLISVSTSARISQDPYNAYHFIANGDSDDHFFLLSKSAFRAMDESYPDQQIDAFIDDAYAHGFNSLRIFLLWGWGDENHPYYLYANPWSTQPAVDPDWWKSNNFKVAYWSRLSHILDQMANNKTPPMEAQFCILDSCVAYGLHEFAGYDYGTELLDYDISSQTISTPLNALIDQLITVCSGSGHDNWRIEIGNQMSDPWERNGGECPGWMSTSFLEWVNLVGTYIHNSAAAQGHLVTNSSPKLDPSQDDFATAGKKPSQETPTPPPTQIPGSPTWTPTPDWLWNVPVSFHAIRSHNWYRDQYYSSATDHGNYWQFRNSSSQYAEKPLVNDEPAKFCRPGAPYIDLTPSPTPHNCDDDSYQDSRQILWGFYITAMGGAYQTYHSEWAFNLNYELPPTVGPGTPTYTFTATPTLPPGTTTPTPPDPGELNIQAFKDKFTLIGNWYEMTPDFEDAIFLPSWDGEPKIAGALNRDSSFPLILKDGNAVEYGYVYFLAEDLPTSGVKLDGCTPLILPADKFPDGSYYYFLWFDPSQPGIIPVPGTTNGKCMSPLTRYINFPDDVQDWLNYVNTRTPCTKCDAVLYVAKTGTGTPTPAPVECKLYLNKTTYSAGDHFILDAERINESTSEASGKYYIVLAVQGQYFCYDFMGTQNWPEVTTPAAAPFWHCPIDAEATPYCQPSPLDFTWPPDVGYLENITFYSAMTSFDNSWISAIAEATFSAWSFDSTTNCYYVDAENGNDLTGNGSCVTPWLSIQHAVMAMPQSAGERLTVVVKANSEHSCIITNKDPLVIPDHVFITGGGPMVPPIVGEENSGLITMGDDTGLSGFIVEKCDVSSEHNCTIANNQFTGLVTGQKQVIWCHNAATPIPTQLIMNNLFYQNEGSNVILCEGNTAPEIMNCTIVDNDGTGIGWSSPSAPTIRNNIIDSNAVGLAIEGSPTSTPTNTSTGSPSGSPTATPTPPAIRYNDITGNTTELSGMDDLLSEYGNISADPEFVAGPDHAFYLSQQSAGQTGAADSPCMNAVAESIFPPYLPFGTTRTDGIMDRGAFDMGYHSLQTKTVVKFTDLNGDYYTTGILQYLGDGAPVDFVGLGSDRQVQVYLNDGNENLTFTNQVFPNDAIDCKVEEFTSTVTVRRDLAIAFAGSVKLYANDGDGEFTLSQVISPTTTVKAIEMALLDDDDCPDLIIGTQGGTDIYFNDCDGAFTFQQHLTGSGISFLVCGDLENDGDIDLITATLAGDNQIYLNDGAGQFTAGQLIQTAATSRIELARVNGDAYPDLVIWLSDCERASYYGDGAGRVTQYHYACPWFTTQELYNQVWDTKIAIKNAKDFNGNLKIAYYDASGNRLSNHDEAPTLAAHATWFRDLSAAFEDTTGSIEIESDCPLNGMMEYSYSTTNTGDHALYSVALQSLDEISDSPQAPWYLTSTWSAPANLGDNTALTAFSLKNPSDSQVTLGVHYYRQNGTQVHQDTGITIDPHAVLYQQLYWNWPSDSGSIEVSANGKLVGHIARIYTNVDSGQKFMHAENLQHIEFASSHMGTPYYLSSSGEDWYWESWFSVKNPWSVTVAAQIKYYDEDGQLVRTDNESIAAHSVNMYGIQNSSPSDIGSIEISADNTVIGHREILGADLVNERLCIASDSLQRTDDGALRYTIPWFESKNAGGINTQTLVTFKNPSASTATIDLTYYDDDGEELTATITQLVLGAKELDTITLSGGDPAAHGSIEAVSDIPVIGQIERFTSYNNGVASEYGIDAVQAVK